MTERPHHGENRDRCRGSSSGGENSRGQSHVVMVPFGRFVSQRGRDRRLSVTGTSGWLTKQFQFATVCCRVITWPEFRHRQPEMAAEGTALLYDVGVGLGYLATTRPDGAPRVHPMCPIVTTETNEDAFYVTGRARHMEASDLRQQVGEQFAAERAALSDGARRPSARSHGLACAVTPGTSSATTQAARTPSHSVMPRRSATCATRLVVRNVTLA